MDLPLICVVDDAQWLDPASLQTLEFVARRLQDAPVAILFAVRESEGDESLSGLPELELAGLTGRDAEDLLDASGTAVLDEAVRDRILAESHGNPLALLELPRGLSATELTFGAVGARGRHSPGPAPRTGLPPQAGALAREHPAAAARRGG